MEADKKRTYGQFNNVYRTEGTAAVKVKDYRYYETTAPKIEEPKEDETKERKLRSNEKPQQKTEKSTKERQAFKPKAEQNINVFSMMILVAAIAVALYTCLGYLHVQADIVVANKSIKALESELSALKTRNDAAYNDVIKSVDFDEVYTVAVRDLGMVFPNKNTVITYNVGKTGFVRQYADIPEAEKLAGLKALIP